MKAFVASLGLLLGAWAGAGPAGATALVLTPSATQIAVGGTVSIDVSISGLGAEILSTYDLNFQYNDSVLSLFSGTPDLTQLGPSVDAGQGDPADPLTFVNGNLGYWANSLETDPFLQTNQLDDFLLFSFVLTGAANGVTQFTLGADPDFERLLGGLNAGALAASIGSVCIGVGTGQCTVPEPSSFALAGLALAGAMTPMALRRRRGKTEA